MKILAEKENASTQMFAPGNVIKDNAGDHYIVITAKKYDGTSGTVTYSGYGVTNIKNGETFLYDSLDDMKWTLRSVVKKIVRGKHIVDFDIKGEE